ncbi:hypothetical protein BXZ70DRAFT_142775 [Cristinia sonorae]|uniref:Uncharacterized protein n=1 Tax=Cristinia sonorae TaxID=1940300 RepID=A0A8K0UNM9_9AGAR|nr:hypothetical protein BXZ70DRAFT_142775 [Cristinia sonorae]
MSIPLSADLGDIPHTSHLSDSPSLPSRFADLLTGRLDSSSSIASEYWSTASSTISSPPSPQSLPQEFPHGALPGSSCHVSQPQPLEPESIANAIPILKLPNDSIVSESNQPSVSPSTPKAPHFLNTTLTSLAANHTIPPSPTLSSHSHASRYFRESRNTTTRPTLGLSLLSIGEQPHRRSRSLPSTPGGSSVSVVVTDERHGNAGPHLRSSFMNSQVSTLGTHTNIDVGAGVVQTLEVEVVKEVRDGVDDGAIVQGQEVAEVAVKVTGGGALAKFRRSGKLAGRARKIIKNFWKVKPSEVIEVTSDRDDTPSLCGVPQISSQVPVEVETCAAVPVDEGQPPATTGVAMIESVVEVDHGDLPNDITELKNEVAQLRARVSRAEQNYNMLKVDLSTLKQANEQRNLKLEEESSTLTALALAESPPAWHNDLVDRFRELEARLSYERNVRKTEMRNLHRIFRESLVGYS